MHPTLAPFYTCVWERERERKRSVCVYETISKIVNVREAKTQPNCKNNQGVVQIMLTYPTIHMYWKKYMFTYTFPYICFPYM